MANFAPFGIPTLEGMKELFTDNAGIDAGYIREKPHSWDTYGRSITSAVTARFQPILLDGVTQHLNSLIDSWSCHEIVADPEAVRTLYSMRPLLVCFRQGLRSLFLHRGWTELAFTGCWPKRKRFLSVAKDIYPDYSNDLNKRQESHLSAE